MAHDDEHDKPRKSQLVRFAEDHWQWLLVVGVVLLLAFVAYLRSRKKPTAGSPPRYGTPTPYGDL